jgi:predicted MFS family arabinose efflux permease
MAGRMDSWRHRHTVLTLTTTTFVCTMVARVVISPLIPRIIDEFAVSRGAIGLALTGMWAIFALVQFPAGVLGERFGERRVVLGALGFTAVGSLLVALSPSYPVFAVLILVVGTGAGLFMPAAASLLTKLFPGTGRALGINTMGSPIGGLVGPIAATALAAAFGWRAGPLGAAALAATVFVLVAWLVRPVEPERADAAVRDRFQPHVLREFLTRPPLVFTTVIAIVGFFAYQAFTSFFPTFLVQYAAFGEGSAGLVFGAAFGLAILGAPLLGWLSDVVGRDAILAVGFLAGAGGIGLFLVTTTLPAMVVGTVLLAGGISWPGVMNSRFMDLLVDDERGAGFGLVRTVFLLVSSLGSVLTGTLADAFSWPVAYGTVIVLFVGAVGLLAANRALGAGL